MNFCSELLSTNFGLDAFYISFRCKVTLFAIPLVLGGKPAMLGTSFIESPLWHHIDFFMLYLSKVLQWSVFNSPTITLMSPFRLIKICFIYLSTLMLDAYILMNVIFYYCLSSLYSVAFVF